MARELLGLVIRGLRRGRSRNQYGAAVGVTYSAVRKYEHGQTLPGWDTCEAIIVEASMSDRERHAFLDLILAASSTSPLEA